MGVVLQKACTVKNYQRIFLRNAFDDKKNPPKTYLLNRDISGVFAFRLGRRINLSPSDEVYVVSKSKKKKK